MSKQIINIGNSANDGAGDPARTAFTKINNNFNEIYNIFGNTTNTNDALKFLGVIGSGQSIVDRTQNRSIGTTFTNSTQRVIFVAILIYSQLSAGDRIVCRVNDIPIFEDYRYNGDSALTHRWFSFLVPVGGTYSINLAGSTKIIYMDRWSELS